MKLLISRRIVLLAVRINLVVVRSAGRVSLLVSRMSAKGGSFIQVISGTNDGCCQIDCHSLHNHSRSNRHSPSSALDCPVLLVVIFVFLLSPGLLLLEDLSKLRCLAADLLRIYTISGLRKSESCKPFMNISLLGCTGGLLELVGHRGKDIIYTNKC